MTDLKFRPLQPDDIVLLHSWLNMPHMRAFYQRTEISLEDVKRKYLPRTKPSSPTRCHIVELVGVPIGKIQCYRNVDYPDYASEIQVSSGTSIDLFIGEPDNVGKGLCRPMLTAYLEVVVEIFPSESEIFICHDRNNAAAIACSKSVGFSYLRDVVESGAPSVLLWITRPVRHARETHQEMLPNKPLEQSGASLAGAAQRPIR